MFALQGYFTKQKQKKTIKFRHAKRLHLFYFLLPCVFQNANISRLTCEKADFISFLLFFSLKISKYVICLNHCSLMIMQMDTNSLVALL